MNSPFCSGGSFRPVRSLGFGIISRAFSADMNCCTMRFVTLRRSSHVLSFEIVSGGGGVQAKVAYLGDLLLAVGFRIIKAAREMGSSLPLSPFGIIRFMRGGVEC